jgi:hypothetical protein
VAAQGIGDGGDLLVVEIGGDLQRHRHIFAVLVGQLQLLGLQLRAGRRAPRPSAVRAGSWYSATRC